MKTCATLQEAQAITGALLINREADDRWVVYEQGDTLPPPPPAPTCPQEVTRRQFRRALLQIGLLGTVDGAVAQSSPEVQVDYADAAVFDRGNPTLMAMAAQLGMTNAQIDDLFTLAASYQQ